MKSLNRTALTIVALDPMKEWVNFKLALDDPYTLEEINSDSSIYLIDELDNPEDDIAKYITKNFLTLFTQELEDWTDDQSLWPTELTLNRFNTWFEIQPHSLIVDLGSKSLELEEY